MGDFNVDNEGRLTKVNNDGSVTFVNQQSFKEKAILDIFRIEVAKGGVFASRQMKKKAIRYACSVNIPNYEMIVEKLMLDHYPAYFKNFQLLRWLAVLAVAFVVYLLGMWTWLMCYYHERDMIETLTCLGAIPFIYGGWGICRKILKNQSE